MIHRRPGLGISHFGQLCSPRSPKSDKSVASPALGSHGAGDTGMCKGHTSDRHVWIYDRPQRRTYLLEFNVPFQHKYGCIRDKRLGVESYPYQVKKCQRYINLNPGRQCHMTFSPLKICLPLQCGLSSKFSDHLLFLRPHELHVNQPNVSKHQRKLQALDKNVHLREKNEKKHCHKTTYWRWSEHTSTAHLPRVLSTQLSILCW